MFPFTEQQIDDVYVRTFSSDVHELDLEWHRDREDRIVTCKHQTDWKFQFDNETPINFDKPIFINKHTYHRIIRGNGDLTLEIKKL
jgi:hypothetical protein